MEKFHMYKNLKILKMAFEICEDIIQQMIE